MKSKRPVNLDLKTIKLPVMGLASILHRISAVLIWVAMAFFLPSLYISLESPQGFSRIEQMLTESFIAQFIVWGFLTALAYYAMGGLKHIIQEMGYCESLQGGKYISIGAISSGVLLSILAAVWIWM